jgi:hypothetical protein
LNREFRSFFRYLLQSAPSHLASTRAIELRQEIEIKKIMSLLDPKQGIEAERSDPPAPAFIAPSLSARARPEARIAAARAAELTAQRRAAANGSATQNEK